MSTNLINNYTNQNKANKALYSNAQISNSTNSKPVPGLKPLEGKGHLIKGSLLDAPSYMIKDLAYDVQALKNGINGKSNDHKLGKLNDLGMKLGGLGIAAFLYTKKQTPMTKSMEFVGFASFFASMALWPKIALQAPASLLHGFNVQQKYVDSFGRKKLFFQDPQYTPWDLYSDKDINKIGNRLGVPKDIPNRRDFIQEKMKKIAVQNNTMWMLTAGFATPIMSALICNAAEKVILPAQNKLKNDRINKTLNNIEQSAKKYDFQGAKDQFENLFEANKEKPFDEEMVSSIAKAITPEMNPFVRDEVVKDLKNILMNENGTIDESFINALHKEYKELTTEYFSDNIEHLEKAMEIIPDTKQITDFLDSKKLLGVQLDKTNKEKVSDTIERLFSVHTRNTCCSVFGLKEMPETPTNRNEKFAKYIDKNLDTMYQSAIKNTIENNPGKKFTVEVKAEIENIAKVLQDHLRKSFVLEDYAYTKVAKAPETVLANQWNKIADGLPELFGISKKEMANVRYDRTLVQELIRAKIEKIASNETEYKKVVTKIAQGLKELDSNIKPEDMTKFYNETDNLYNTSADNLAEKKLYLTAKKLKGIDTPQWEQDKINTLKKLVSEQGAGVKEETLDELKYFEDRVSLREAGSMKRLQKVFVEQRLSGVKNAYYRLLSTLDLYRRVATKDFGPIINGRITGGLDEGMKDEVRKDIIEASKRAGIENHCSDEAIKGYYPRNPNPDLKATGKIDVVEGKVVGQEAVDIIEGTTKGVDIPYDYNFYKNTMQFRFKNEMNKSTTDALKEVGLLEEVKNYRTKFFNTLGSANYFSKLSHKIGKSVEANFEEKFLLCGVAVDELFTNIINKSFNTNKWLKIFGGFGIGLLGVTVGSQFLFGRMKNPQKVKKA